MKKLIALLCAAALLFAFAACGREEDGLTIGGYDAVQLDDGIYYVDVARLQSDPGENLSALDCARTAWAALKNMDLRAEDGDSIHISLMGVDNEEGEDRYAYSVGMGRDYLTGDDFVHVYSIWVNYAGDVFAFMGGEMLVYSPESNAWEPVPDGIGQDLSLDEEQAMSIASELLGVQLAEGLALVASGEDEVNGQRAFLFSLGTNREEKFTAEEHYAVTDDGKVWLLDIIANEWVPAAAG